MSNGMTLLLLLELVLATVGGMAVVIPWALKKGGNVSGTPEGAGTALDTADVVIDTMQEFLPDVAAFQLIDRVIDWAKKATEAAEQLYKTSQIEEGRRKEEATRLVYEFIEAAGVQVDDNMRKIIDGAIEAAVFALPKTHDGPTE